MTKPVEPQQNFAFTEAVGFAEPVDDPVLKLDLDNQDLGGGTAYVSDWIDMRAFNSYQLQWFMSDNGSTLDAFDTAFVEISFGNKKPDDTMVTLFHDKWGMYPNFTNLLSDAMHAGWMKFFVSPLWANQDIKPTVFDLRLFGSYRSIPSLWIRNTGATLPTNAIYGETRTFVGADSDEQAALLDVGPALATLSNTGAGTATMTIEYAMMGQPDVLQITGPGRVEKSLILPNGQPYVTIESTDATTIEAKIITESRRQ